MLLQRHALQFPTIEIDNFSEHEFVEWQRHLLQL